MKPNKNTVESILKLGGVWRFRDIQAAAKNITGDSKMRHRIGWFLDKLMKLGKVERVRSGHYQWI
jgi:hypothetical protein